MVIEVIQQYPRLSLIAIAFLISLFITIVQYFVLDRERIRELKKKQKELQIEIRNQTNPTKKMELSQEMMKHSMETMRHSFKPMIITMIPVLIVFYFIRHAYSETIIASSWIWYYLGAAIVSSLILRKIFKLP